MLGDVFARYFYKHYSGEPIIVAIENGEEPTEHEVADSREIVEADLNKQCLGDLIALMCFRAISDDHWVAHLKYEYNVRSVTEPED